MIARDDFKLKFCFRYLEWLSIAFVTGAQVLWMNAAVRFDWLIGISFSLLALCCVVSAFTPKTMRWWLIQLIGQVVLVCAASAFGAHYFYYLILYVLAAKAALMLPRGQLVSFGAGVTVAHVLAWQFATYAFHHIHTMRHPVPAYYRPVVLEGESDVYFLIGLVTVAFLGRTLLNERKSRAAEQNLSREVGSLAVKLERARIARDIHDGLGHSLNSTKIQLERALKLLENNQVDGVLDLLKRCQDSTRSSLREVRQAARAEQDQQFSLAQNLTELIDQIKDESALTFAVQLTDMNLPAEIQYQLFNIIQECLTNVRKHSSADHVEITLKREGDMAFLCVRDNGKGFDMSNVHSGFGRKGLFERADSIGATLNIASIIGGGTEITLRFPSTVPVPA